MHPFEDSDSSEDEVDWQDTRHDPYRAGNFCTTKMYKKELFSRLHDHKIMFYYEVHVKIFTSVEPSYNLVLYIVT